jgi:transposase-like protein
MNTAVSQRVMHTPAWAEGAATREFPNEDACLEFIKETRWPKGVPHCAKCGIARKHHRVRGRKAYACDRCGAHVYPLRGTIFARSSTSLLKWFHVIWLLTSAAPRITAKRIQRETGVTYKTAWRMLHRLRATEVSRALPPRRFLELVVASAAQGDAREQRITPASAPSAGERHGS